MIEKLKKVDDRYEDPDGCTWGSPGEYLLIGVLPSCGCGSPELLGMYVRRMLREHVVQSETADCACWSRNRYDDDSLMFFLSWACREGYIEHGTTIRCSWMTEKGNELLRDLDAVL